MRSAPISSILTLALVVVGCAVEATERPEEIPTGNLNRIAGTVLETIDAASYTYVRFETSDGEAWAAVPRARLETGSQVVIANPQAMPNFESKTLGRTFDTVYFGTLENPLASSPMAKGPNPHASMRGGMERPAPTADATTAPIKVEKAAGATGRTVAELFAEGGKLSGKAVALRGKVVKYSPGIMGRNWIHLQDGTGDAEAGTHDITVTSSVATAVGDIIVIEGIVAIDKDFGAGYLYDVIVEDATVK